MVLKKATTDDVESVIEICLTAGRLMIEGGSEMYRVEDTMSRIARNAGIEDPRVFATPTGVFISLNGGEFAQITQVRDRNINLELVDRVNELSREFAAEKITLRQLRGRLQQVANATPTFPLWLQVICASLLSATLMILFTGEYDWLDFPVAAVIGAIGFLIYIFMKKYTRIRFLAELLAAIFMTLITVWCHQIFRSLNIDAILIGSLMTLVPGVALTNALRDLFSGDLISGIARGVEALLTAVALGGGVGIVIKFLGA